MMHKTLKLGAAVLAAATCLLAMTIPASATIHTYNVEMVSGRITVGTTTFDTPGVGITTCPGGTTITGTINDAGGTHSITGTLSINAPFVLPIFGGNYVLLATGSATGTSSTAGTYNPATGTFSNLAFTNLAFTIRTYNATTCAAGTTIVCTGTASLTASGGLYNGATLPLSASEEIYVNATGTVVTRPSCSFPFNVFVTVGTTVTVGENPNHDHPPAGTPEPGAIFHQL